MNCASREKSRDVRWSSPAIIVIVSDRRVPQYCWKSESEWSAAPFDMLREKPLPLRAGAPPAAATFCGAVAFAGLAALAGLVAGARMAGRAGAGRAAFDAPAWSMRK